MYENNDPNTENNESSTYRYTPERGTQSDYTAGAHNADSQYSAGPQSGCIPGSYSYSPEPPKKKKKLSAGKIIAIALACALLGAALFSFMNVVAWRLPRGMDPLKGRSVCPQCGHTLGAPDLVPVFSWLFLRGRCRHCGAHIPARYLLVELLGGVLALGCTWRYGAAYALPGGLFGMSWAALLALAVCGILLSVSLIDAETQTIPDRLNLALAVFGAVSVLLSPADWLPHVIGALCVSVPMFLLCLVIDGAFGGGDIKLMAAAGLFLGWQNTLLAMFFGIVFGGMYGIYLLAAKKAGKKDHFAFGPFLCAGIVIAMLFGGPVLEWYCAFL